MEKDVFTFEDFINKPKDSKTELKPSEKLLQEIKEEILEDPNNFTEDEIEIDQDEVLYKMKDLGWGDLTGLQMEEFENSPSYSGTKNTDEYTEEFDKFLDRYGKNKFSIEESKENNDESYYKLYKDKNEEFICDISIEGANPDETSARIVIESKDWTLMFNGELKNGKCVVPIKRLNILPEGQIGNIRLEVIAEGNLFVPWEDKFKVKLSKKITVKVNEQKEAPKKNEKNGIRVNVKKR